MSIQSASTIGSGTLLFTTQILPSSQRGQIAGALGQRVGTNVVVINPEDQIAVDAFAVSGVSITTTPTRVWGPGINSLPRQRDVRLQNLGPGSVYIGPTSTAVIAPSGFRVAINTTIDLPLLYNVDVWARADGGGASITIIAY
jgi:hypothetical protein